LGKSLRTGKEKVKSCVQKFYKKRLVKSRAFLFFFLPVFPKSTLKNFTVYMYRLYAAGTSGFVFLNPQSPSCFFPGPAAAKTTGIFLIMTSLIKILRAEFFIFLKSTYCIQKIINKRLKEGNEATAEIWDNDMKRFYPVP
jgi:hypothetical protein